VKLIFARGYNPAYDYCLTKSFQDHGIAYGEESTFDEAKRLVLAFQEKAGMDPRWKDVFNPMALVVRSRAATSFSVSVRQESGNNKLPGREIVSGA